MMNVEVLKDDCIRKDREKSFCICSKATSRVVNKQEIDDQKMKKK